MRFETVLKETQLLCQSLLETATNWQEALWLDELHPELELRESGCHQLLITEVNDARRAFVSRWSRNSVEFPGRLLAVDIEGSLG